MAKPTATSKFKKFLLYSLFFSIFRNPFALASDSKESEETVNIWDWAQKKEPEPEHLPVYLFGPLFSAQFRLGDPDTLKIVTLTTPAFSPFIWLADSPADARGQEQFNRLNLSGFVGIGEIFSQDELQLHTEVKMAWRFWGGNVRYRRIFTQIEQQTGPNEPGTPADHIATHLTFRLPPRRFIQLNLDLGMRIVHRDERVAKIGLNVFDEVTRKGIEFGFPAEYTLGPRSNLIVTPYFTYLPEIDSWLMEEDLGFRFWLSRRVYCQLLFNMLIEAPDVIMGPYFSIGFQS